MTSENGFFPSAKSFVYILLPVEPRTHGKVIKRVPGGSSLAKKVTNIHVYINDPCACPCKNMEVCRAQAGGCGPWGPSKGPNKQNKHTTLLC